ncbi:hypothetical protein BGX38DRAFT_1272849 [Terfezia claveryi]|nr:hypothetical protein BGX38DRAFT_1272849 [Terfezia claveryi]
MTTAPPPRGIVYGPITDWGKGEFSEFGEKGAEALSQAMENTEQARKAWAEEGDWCRHISQMERNLRVEEEVIRVGDGPLVVRAIMILNRAVAIQDRAANGQLDGYQVDYCMVVKGDDLLESITVRQESELFGTIHHWTLMTSGSGKLADIEARTGDREGVGEDEGKKRRLGDTEARKESGKEIQEGQGGEPSGGTLTAMDWGKEYISEAGQPGGVGASQIGLEASQPEGAEGSQLGGLEASQHAARELTEKEVRNLTREIVERQAEGRGDENMGDENMDGEEKQRGEQKRT